MNEALTDRQRRIIQRVAAGEDWRAAARAEGCSDSYSRVVGHRLKKNPVVVKMLEEIQSKGREIAAYDLARAMKEAAEVIEFAKKHRHPTAFFFAVRHRAHLSGLLVDRFEIATVDLTGALARAEARVLGAVGPGALSPLLAREGIDWRPKIAGSRSADPEEGLADGESVRQVKNG